MQYFLLKQNRDYSQTPSIENFHGRGFMRKNFTPSGCKKIEDINMVMSPSKEALQYLDVLDTQVFLVSKEVKKVFSLYDPSMRFKMFIMMNNLIAGGQTGEYYAPIFREVECASPSSEFNLDKSYIKKLALIESKVSHLPIFRVGGIRAEATIVRLDVAESLMRRKFLGLKFEKVGVE